MATVTIAAGAEPVVARTPEQIERYWFENVYQGDKLKQLTARAVIMGMGLGMIMTAMPAVNAIPAVVAAPPGIATHASLPLVTAGSYVS